MYNKLFTRILYSSIWTEAYATRLVWIAMLAAMDEDGIVHAATPRNLAALAGVTVEEAEQAVATLSAPDPESSNPDREGRRIERFPGGWVVTNAVVYRDMATRMMIRAQTRERVRRHRELGGGDPSKWTAIRASVLRRDHGICRYCLSPATEVDHVVPVSRGGTDDVDNLVAACRPCNSAKNNRLPDEAGLTLHPVTHGETQQVTHRVTQPVTPSEAEANKRSRSSRRDDHDRTPKPTTPKDGHRVTFDGFWSRYPRKVAKANAWKAWAALKPDSALVETISTALEAQRRSEAWTRDDGRFIPHAATWLRGRRWEDVVETPPPAATGTEDARRRTVDVVASRLALLRGRVGGDR